MDIIFASDTEEIGYANSFYSYDFEESLSTDSESNTWELILPISEWKRFKAGHAQYVYVLGTEYGGQIEEVKYTGELVKLTGPTWRGMLAKSCIPRLSDTEGDGIITPIGDGRMRAAGSFVSVLTRISGFPFVVADNPAQIELIYRYNYLLQVIQKAVPAQRLIVKTRISDAKPELSLAPYRDLSELYDLEKDLGGKVEYLEKNLQTREVVVLGSGEGIDRLIVRIYQDFQGDIQHEISPKRIDSRNVYYYDYNSIDTAEEAIEVGTKKFLELNTYFEINATIPMSNIDLCIGDIVSAKHPITMAKHMLVIERKILRQKPGNIQIEYRTSDVERNQ